MKVNVSVLGGKKRKGKDLDAQVIGLTLRQHLHAPAKYIRGSCYDIALQTHFLYTLLCFLEQKGLYLKKSEKVS